MRQGAQGMFVMCGPTVSPNDLDAVHAYNALSKATQRRDRIIALLMLCLAIAVILFSTRHPVKNDVKTVTGLILFFSAAAAFQVMDQSTNARITRRLLSKRRAVEMDEAFIHAVRLALSMHHLTGQEREFLDWISKNHFEGFKDTCQMWTRTRTSGPIEATSAKGRFNDAANGMLLRALEVLVREFPAHK